MGSPSLAGRKLLRRASEGTWLASWVGWVHHGWMGACVACLPASSSSSPAVVGVVVGVVVWACWGWPGLAGTRLTGLRRVSLGLTSYCSRLQQQKRGSTGLCLSASLPLLLPLPHDDSFRPVLGGVRGSQALRLSSKQRPTAIPRTPPLCSNNPRPVLSPPLSLHSRPAFLCVRACACVPPTCLLAC
ncbi:unnamed protein product [Periconia digitata]|uniref:Uncharacterized protein n=1 Tax=Periconia digitata TaxID=1303443 RepID=A0A9W4UMD9_9PLEO|nr:unnamed protein product [Periconia digitata]